MRKTLSTTLILTILGISFCAYSTQILVGPDATNDAELKNLAEKSTKAVLSIRNISDAGMVVLKEFSALQMLSITSTEVTDQGLSSLKPLIQLSQLSLENTNVTGTGFKDMQSLPQLTRLDLDGSPINDEALRWISSYKNLVILSLMGTQVTGVGLASLKSLSNLKELNLSKSVIADAQISGLASLSSLEKLNLEHTKITDASVSTLKQLMNMKSLSLNGTMISNRGIGQLQTALPLTVIQPQEWLSRTPENHWRNMVQSCLNFSGSGSLKTKIASGGQAISEKKYQQAIESYSSAVKDAKIQGGRCWWMESATQSLLADAYRQSGNLKEAKKSYEVVLSQISNGLDGKQFPSMIKLVKQVIESLDHAK